MIYGILLHEYIHPRQGEISLGEHGSLVVFAALRALCCSVCYHLSAHNMAVLSHYGIHLFAFSIFLTASPPLHYSCTMSVVCPLRQEYSQDIAEVKADMELQVHSTFFTHLSLYTCALKSSVLTKTS